MDGLFPDEEEIQKLKEKYSQEQRDDPDNPLRICMKLIFEAATTKEKNERLRLSSNLSKFLTETNGVLNLFLAVVDFDTTSQKSTTHNQRFLAIASIITCLPQLCIPVYEYFSSITIQLLPFLISENNKYSNLASIILRSMLTSPYATTLDLAKPLIDELHCGLTKKGARLSLKQSVSIVNNLILNSYPIEHAVGIFPQLFYIYFALKRSPSHFKEPAKSCVVSLLTSLKFGPACCLLEKAILYPGKLIHAYNVSLEDDCVAFADEEGENDPLDTLPSGQIVPFVAEALKACNSEPLVLEFFLHFQESMWTQEDPRARILCASLIQPLLGDAVEENFSKLDLATLLANNMNRCPDFIQRVLLNYVAFLVRSPSIVEGECIYQLVNPSMTSCINILEVLITLSQDTRALKSRCLPLLKQIEDSLYKRKTDKELFAELLTNIQSLIFRMENTTVESSSETDSESDRNASPQLELDNLLKDLNDPLQPVRVHALVRLKQLVISGSNHIVDRVPYLYEIIGSSLSDKESYVYLAAINLVAEMGIRTTSELLPKLIDLHQTRDLDIQHRINVGEVLARISRRLNQTAPHYGKMIMNALLAGCGDQEELMRMSSLTNLGEVCRNLGDSLGNYMLDILDRIAFIVAHDSEQVKSAAIDLLRTALMGLSGPKVESIQRELKSIYRLLKAQKQRSLDSSTCLQVELALGEIDRLVREMLNLDGSERRLVKEIKVLSLLD